MREPLPTRHPEAPVVTLPGSRGAERCRIATLEDLHAHLREREAEIAGCHRALAARLQDLGDAESAALLESLLDEPTRTSAPAMTRRLAECLTSNPVQLLAAAQKPLERLSETLADVLETADAELFTATEQALTNVVGRLARLVFQIERKLQGPEPADS